MKAVWKFPIEAAETQAVAMPTGAQLLHVEAQGSGVGARPCVWALVDSDAPKATRLLGIVGTGHDAARVFGMPHVGSFLLGQGALVFHVFDLGESK